MKRGGMKSECWMKCGYKVNVWMYSVKGECVLSGMESVSECRRSILWVYVECIKK